MDLITPARTWASVEKTEPPHEQMPRLQRIVMFFSVTLPFVGLLGAIVLLWQRHAIGWPQIIAMIVMYSLCGFGVTIGFHRLLTHRAFATPRPVRLLLAILGSAAGQGMCIKWCATHRRHHQVSDREGDPHSPHLHGDDFKSMIKGMWHAHVGWCFDADRPDLSRSVPDLLEDRAMLVIDQLYFLWVALGLLLPAIALGLYTHTWGGFFSGLIWGGLLRVFLMQHVTWSINSVCHVWGTRPFTSADHSTNNLPIALVSLGEGWHNNHHAFPTSARHGLKWWQFDSSYMIIKTMSYIGLASEIRLPSESAMALKAKAA